MSTSKKRGFKEMDTYERIAKKIVKKLHNTHRLDIDSENKSAKLYRTGKFEHGLLPQPSHEGSEEILVAKDYVIVKNLGIAYFSLENAVKKALSEIVEGYKQKPLDDNAGMRYEF